MAKKHPNANRSVEMLAATIRVRRKQTAIEKTKAREAAWTVPTPKQEERRDELDRLTVQALRLLRDHSRAVQKMKDEGRYYKSDDN